MPKLRDLLAAIPDQYVKVADVESPDEVQLEQDFANLAFMFLRDRAAGLMPYLLGFEVVDRAEDGSRAVGIFGFKLAGKYYYVPAFFVNNQVKGMDLLYNKETNSFVPLRETWINHILNKSTIRLGEGANNSSVRRDFEQPNFEFLAEPPVGVKSASDTAVDTQIADAFAVWNNLQGTVVEGLHKDAEFQRALAGAIATLKHEQLDLEKSADGNPIIEYMQKYGGPRAMKAFMRAIQQPKFASAVFEFYPDIKSFYVTEFDSSLAPKTAAARVTVTAKPSDTMDDKERKRLVRDGFSIIDRRDDSEKSQLFDVEFERRYSNPSESGAYEMLLPTGSTTKAWVLQAAGGQPGSALLCVEPDNSFFFTADSTRVYVKGDKLEGPDPYDKAISLGDMVVGRRYALIDQNGNASAPFRVEAATAESGERVRVRVWFDTCVDHTSGRSSGFSSYYDSPFSSNDVKYLQLADHDGKTLRRTGDNLIVPANWKALALTTKWEYEDNQRPVGYDKSVPYETGTTADARNAYDAFAPGNLVDLSESMFKQGIHHLTVDGTDGSQFFMYFDEFVDGPHNLRGAMTRLVTKYGMAVDDAEQVLQQAVTNFKSRHLIKLAQLVGAQVPMLSPPGPSSEDISGMGLPMQEPYSETGEGNLLGAAEWQDSTMPGFASGGQSEMEAGMGDDVNAIAQQAAATGQKHVFDHASIGGLARMYDASAALDMYVPELLKSLDRIGRILFIFYWKNEDFAERYGNEDLAEMEDLLRGVFKAYGDLVLKLKQKSITNSDSGDILTA